MEYTGKSLKLLRTTEHNRRYVANELEAPFGDSYILGAPDNRPLRLTKLTRVFKSFCRMNGFDMTFHDPLHTLASTMIASGIEMCTAASY